MLKRVYIETSIPSFHYTARTDPESLSRMHWTRRWWSECAPRYSLSTSAAVIEELLAGTSQYTQDRLALVRPLELLDINEEVRQVTRMYIRRLVMPNDPTGGLAAPRRGFCPQNGCPTDVELSPPGQPKQV